MKIQFQTLLLAAVVVLAGSSSSKAASFVHLRDAAGGEGPFLSGAVLTGAGYIQSWHGRAGTLDFEMSFNGADGDYFDLLTYCGDPFRPLSVGPVGGQGGAFQVISMMQFLPNSSDIVAIEKLWKIAYQDSTTSATKAAAFQFLLWEYIADATVDFGAGAARITDTSVLAQANQWNSMLSTASARAALMVLDGRSENKQSFFLEQRVANLIESPEPATYFLIAGALLTLGYFRRKT